MRIRRLTGDFTVCQVADYSQVAFSQPYVFVGKTDEENSLVCPTEAVPANVTAREDGWRAFRIEGTLDFSLIGILSAINTLLAENRIGIFAISTFNTDYVLTKAENCPRAIEVLAAAGYEIVE